MPSVITSHKFWFDDVESKILSSKPAKGTKGKFLHFDSSAEFSFYLKLRKIPGLTISKDWFITLLPATPTLPSLGWRIDFRVDNFDKGITTFLEYKGDYIKFNTAMRDGLNLRVHLLSRQLKTNERLSVVTRHGSINTGILTSISEISLLRKLTQEAQ